MSAAAMTDDEKIEAAFLKELSWMDKPELHNQRAAWIKEWKRIYEIGRRAVSENSF